MPGAFKTLACKVMVSILSVFALTASPQEAAKVPRTTVTGCLQKGDETEVFTIHGEDGMNYELVSRNVKLSAHIGHRVRVTGALMEDESEEQEGTGGGWDGKIYVSSLKMISRTCKHSK
jgi:hypothetical protein